MLLLRKSARLSALSYLVPSSACTLTALGGLLLLPLTM
jgi:hypothetical protein